MGRTILVALTLTAATGCSMLKDDAGSGTVSHAFSQPPLRAAECLARNAERHSSALAAQVGRPDASGNVEVSVRVRNGVPYASALLRPSGRGSQGTLTLMVVSKGGSRQLVESLVEGC